MRILIVAAVVVLAILLPAMKMSGICSREEEREWKDGKL